MYNKLLSLSNNSPDFITEKAILFERNKEIDSAKRTYLLAAAAYSKKLSTSSNDVGAINGLIRLKALTQGKDAAISELDSQIKAHPDLATKLNSKRYYYENFDDKQN